MKHLEMTQGVINRLAGNSFIVKGWSVTLVSALFALAAKEADVRYVLLGIFPVGMFWGLDGYFLYQERLFRKLYDKVRLSENDTDFSMNTKGLWNWKVSWPAAILSPASLLFYGIVLFAIGIVKCRYSGH